MIHNLSHIVYFQTFSLVFRFSCESRDFWRPATFLDQSRIGCQGKLSEISQSTLCLQKNEKLENHWIVPEMSQNRTYIGIILTFLWCLIFLVRAEISGGLQLFLTSLELVVKENYLRSRTAPCACKKMENRKITELYHKCHEMGHILV